MPYDTTPQRLHKMLSVTTMGYRPPENTVAYSSWCSGTATSNWLVCRLLTYTELNHWRLLHLGHLKSLLILDIPYLIRVLSINRDYLKIWSNVEIIIMHRLMNNMMNHIISIAWVIFLVKSIRIALIGTSKESSHLGRFLSHPGLVNRSRLP